MGKPEFVGHTSDGSVDVIIDGKSYTFAGVDIPVYLIRKKTYKYKPFSLLNFLKKNSSGIIVNNQGPTFKPARKKVTKYESEQKRRNIIAIKINATKQKLLNKGFKVDATTKSIRVYKCDNCGKMALIRGLMGKDVVATSCFQCGVFNKI